MPVSEQVGVVAVRAGEAFVTNMFTVFARRVTIVLGRTGRMAGGTLAVDIN